MIRVAALPKGRLLFRMKIDNDPEYASQFIEAVIDGAKAEASALGFIPSSAYEEAALKGRLVVASEEDRFLGFVLFGGKFPILKVSQTFVDKDHRGSGVGRGLVDFVCNYGNQRGYSSIRARVAATLPANQFWQEMNFDLVHQEEGKPPKRNINVYEYQLDALVLFSDDGYSQGLDSLRADRKPTIETPNYAIDINAALDLVKERKNEQVVRHVVMLATSGEINLFRTSEFIKESSRHGKRLGNGLTQMLGALKELPPKEIASDAINNLKSIIFPKKELTQQDESDLRHLAQCATHGLTGFITSDKALLNAHNELKERYGLEIVSPGEFYIEKDGDPKALLIDDDQEGFEIKGVEVADEDKLIRFLDAHFHNKTSELKIDMTQITPLSRIVSIKDKIVGALILRSVPGQSPVIRAIVCLREELTSSSSIANCLLGILLTDITKGSSVIELTIPPSADKTRRQAMQLGFINMSSRPDCLVKYNYNEIINKSNWGQMCDDIKNFDLKIKRSLPSKSEIKNTGLPLFIGANKRILKLHDFETFLSPLIIVFSGRKGVIVPIREEFSHLLVSKSQGSLLPAEQATIRAERAYFAHKRSVANIKKGDIVVFYESGRKRGNKQAIGLCRVTASGVFPTDMALVNFKAQGVYPEHEIKKLGEEVGVFSFDNFKKFGNPIPYRKLVKMECVTRANLVTSQRVDHTQLKRIIEEGFRV